MSLTIYANGNEAIGYGHLFRTSALAQMCLEQGYKVRYVTTTPETTREVIPKRAVLTSIESDEDLVNLTESKVIDVLVTDSYGIGQEIYQRLKDSVPRLAVVSDHARSPVCCDILINGNLYARDLDYKWIGNEPEWYLGPEFLLLRNEIRQRIHREISLGKEPKRAIITMGGSDVRQMTPSILRAFDGFDMQIDAIVGPGFSSELEQEIREVASEVSVDVSTNRSPDDLAERMLQSDFGITTASTTIYELLALGTPIICVPVADHQEPIASSLREDNLAHVVDRGAGTEDIRRGIDQYTSDVALKKKRRDLGQNIVDGRGAERICSALFPG
jgi:spore coat polysaccharide biosynthesis predicted glycosyltransferase SpsG